MNMLLAFIVVFGLALIVKLYFPFPKKQVERTKPKPVALRKRANDKLVIVSGAPFAEIRKLILQFCDLYNRDELSAVPVVTQLDEQAAGITFPYNVSFDVFCYFVNYMYYPGVFFHRTNVRGWATVSRSDVWVSEQLAGKQVMLFIPPEDKEYDNVYLTSADHQSYLITFAEEGRLLLSETVKTGFEEPPVSYTTIINKPGEEIR